MNPPLDTFDYVLGALYLALLYICYAPPEPVRRAYARFDQWEKDALMAEVRNRVPSRRSVKKDNRTKRQRKEGR
jgi:hypothetical protein